MELGSIVNGYVDQKTLSTEPEACLQSAPIGVSDGEHLLGVVLDPLSYEGLMALAIAYRRQQSGEEYPQAMSEQLTAFIELGERLLGETSTGLEDDEGHRARTHRDPNSDDQAPS